MGEASLGQKISWFLYQKGMGVAKPEFLLMVKFADPEWFKIAETMIKDNNLEGRDMVLQELLQTNVLRAHPKRQQIMQMLLRFLSKGILDERRAIVKFVDENPEVFDKKDALRDQLLGALLTAQRDSDHTIANTAETAYAKVKGDEPAPTQKRERGL
jgi:hypothetical protein